MAIPIPKPLEIDLAADRQHIRQVRATAEQQRTMRRALDNWQRVTQIGQITERRLRPIVEAAKNGYTAVWTMCVDLLANLVQDFPAAKEGFREIMGTGNASQRWHMITSLTYCKDRSFCREVVKGAIDDRATSVRYRAAHAADMMRLTMLVPALKKRRGIETSQHVQSGLDRVIAMLTDGYMVQPGPPNDRRLNLLVRVPYGWSHALIEPEDLETGRVQEIVEAECKDSFLDSPLLVRIM